MTRLPIIILIAALLLAGWTAVVAQSSPQAAPGVSPLTSGENLSVASIVLLIALNVAQIVQRALDNHRVRLETDAVGKANARADLAVACEAATGKELIEEREARKSAEERAEYYRKKAERLAVQYASRTGEPPKSSPEIQVPKS